MTIIRILGGFLIATLGGFWVALIVQGMLILSLYPDATFDYMQTGKASENISGSHSILFSLIAFLIIMGGAYLGFRLIPKNYLKWLFIPVALIHFILFGHEGEGLWVNLLVMLSIIALYFYMKRKDKLYPSSAINKVASYFLVLCLLAGCSGSDTSTSNHSNTKAGKNSIITKAQFEILKELNGKDPSVWSNSGIRHEGMELISETDILSIERCKPLSIDEICRLIHTENKGKWFEDHNFIPYAANNDLENRNNIQFVNYGKCRTDDFPGFIQRLSVQTYFPKRANYSYSGGKENNQKIYELHTAFLEKNAEKSGHRKVRPYIGLVSHYTLDVYRYKNCIMAIGINTKDRENYSYLLQIGDEESGKYLLEDNF